MHEAIAVNAMFILQVGSELRNDVEFLKEEAKENQDVISVVAKNLSEFEFDGIKAVQETSKELTFDDCLKLIDELVEKSDDARFEKMSKKISEIREQERQEAEKNNEKYDGKIKNPVVMKWVTAMVAQREDLNPELVKKVLDYSILTMEKTKRDVGEDGRMKLTIENAQSLITPTIINRIKGIVEKQGYEVDREYEKAIASYTMFYEEFNKQYREEIKNNPPDFIRKKLEEARSKATETIPHEQITELTKSVSQSEIVEVKKEILEVQEKEINKDNLDVNVDKTSLEINNSSKAQKNSKSNKEIETSNSIDSKVDSSEVTVEID
jgi:hypothetical protein